MFTLAMTQTEKGAVYRPKAAYDGTEKNETRTEKGAVYQEKAAYDGTEKNLPPAAMEDARLRCPNKSSPSACVSAILTSTSIHRPFYCCRSYMQQRHVL